MRESFYCSSLDFSKLPITPTKSCVCAAVVFADQQRFRYC